MAKPDPDDKPLTMLDWLGLKGAKRYARARANYNSPEMFLQVAIIGAILTLLVILGAVIWHSITGALLAGLIGYLGMGLVAGSSLNILYWCMKKYEKLRLIRQEQFERDMLTVLEKLRAQKTVTTEQGETRVPLIEERIVGIYMLEALMQFSIRSDRGRDHVRLMDILCAYIRHNAPAKLAKDHDFCDWLPFEEWQKTYPDIPKKKLLIKYRAAQRLRFERTIRGVDVRQWAFKLERPRPDIQVALRVIGLRNTNQRLVEARWGKDAAATDVWVFDTEHCPTLPEDDDPVTEAELEAFKDELAIWKAKIGAYRGYRLDLRDTCLQGADLSDLLLSGACLQGARMEGANLSGARLDGANLRNARLEGAYLNVTRMEGADLREARLEQALTFMLRLEGADLRKARLENVNFLGSGRRLQGANMCGARMENIDLGSALLQGADLSGARMEGASLFQTRMKKVDLSNARVERAILCQAQLEGANLRGARMERTNLLQVKFDAATCWEGADVSQARAQDLDLSTTPISMEQINSMFGDASVILPGGITPSHEDWPAHWPKEKLDWIDLQAAYLRWRSAQP